MELPLALQAQEQLLKYPESLLLLVREEPLQHLSQERLLELPLALQAQEQLLKYPESLLHLVREEPLQHLSLEQEALAAPLASHLEPVLEQAQAELVVRRPEQLVPLAQLRVV
jgi:3-polyprenyl-4-hydroxybenzoate decarboxylase